MAPAASEGDRKIVRKKTKVLTLSLLTLAIGLSLVFSSTFTIDPLADAEPPELNMSGLLHQKQIKMLYSEEEVNAIAKLIYGEIGADSATDEEKEWVAATPHNRTKNIKWVSYVGSDDMMTQLTYPSQFYYNEAFPVTERHYRIAYDILWRASQIEQGCKGIPWPHSYCCYWGDGTHNHFYDEVTK